MLIFSEKTVPEKFDFYPSCCLRLKIITCLYCDYQVALDEYLVAPMSAIREFAKKGIDWEEGSCDYYSKGIGFCFKKLIVSVSNIKFNQIITCVSS